MITIEARRDEGEGEGEAEEDMMEKKDGRDWEMDG